MKEFIEPIAETLVNNADKEEIIFVRNSAEDNMMQLIFEQRVTVENVDTAVNEKAPPETRKKIFLYIANELIKYLSAKLVKSRLSSFRSAPKSSQEPKKKLSKSEQFLERKRKEALEKTAQEESEKGGTAQKIGLKDIGKEIEEREGEKQELEKKRQAQQEETETEYSKHTTACQIAYDLFAHAVAAGEEKDNNVGEICDLIKQMGNEDMIKRQITLGKMSSHPQRYLAIDALLAAMRDKNVIIQIIDIVQTIGERKLIVPLINVIKEYPTPQDLLFRGPAERAIGETVRLMNEKMKGSGTKYVYQLCANPKFEPMLRTLARIIARDIDNAKTRKEYFTPQCLKSMSLIAEKLSVQKKKTVKIGFVNVTKHTELSKQLGEFVTTVKQNIQ